MGTPLYIRIDNRLDTALVMVSELLDASEPAPYEVHWPGATAPQLAVCDHA